MSLTQTIDESIQSIGSNLVAMKHLLDVMNTRVGTAVVPTGKDDFLEVRDEMISISQNIADILHGPLAEAVSSISNEFTIQLLGAISANQSAPKLLDADIMERTEEWLDPEQHGYVLTGHILKYFNDCGNALKLEVPSYIANEFFTNESKALYAPTVLANTVGFFNAINESGTMRDFVETMSAMKQVFDTVTRGTSDSDIFKFIEMLQAKEFVYTIANIDTLSPEVRQAIKGSFDKAITLLSWIERLMRTMSAFNAIYKDLIPKVAVTAQTVNGALDFYNRHSEVQF